jgi:hypothetical protein
MAFVSDPAAKSSRKNLQHDKKEEKKKAQRMAVLRRALD